MTYEISLPGISILWMFLDKIKDSLGLRIRRATHTRKTASQAGRSDSAGTYGMAGCGK